MERKQFTFYRSFLDAIRRLPKKEQGAILCAVCYYALDEQAPEKLSPIAETVFTLIRPTLDASRRKSAGNLEESSGKPRGNPEETPGNDGETAGEISRNKPH